MNFDTVWLSLCGFRSMAITRFGRSRSPVSDEADHRAYPGATRPLIPAESGRIQFNQAVALGVPHAIAEDGRTDTSFNRSLQQAAQAVGLEDVVTQ